MNVSVVMTTYNGDKYLEQQIESILNQTLKPFELIVCDDGSTDSTVEILKEYSRQSKLTYVVNPSRLGVIDNFKKAVSLANPSNYVALADQDDQWLPEKLNRSAALLHELEDDQLPCMVYTDLLLVDENEKILNKSFRNELGQDKYEHTLQTLLFGNFINGCTILMNPALHQMFADIPRDVRLNHDGWIALAAFTFGKAEGINEPLVRYRKHMANLSIDVNTKPKNRYRSTFNQIIDSFTNKEEFLAVQFETVGRFYNMYHSRMDAATRQHFNKLLELQGRPYLVKKLAFRRMVKAFKASK